MIATKTTIHPASPLKAAAASRAVVIATHVMRETNTQPVFRAVALAWPAITDVAERLSYYLSENIQVPGAGAPLLHESFRRFNEQMGDWQQDGLTTQSIRYAVAAMLCTVRELSGIRVWRGDFQWDPTLGVSFTEFAQGQEVRIETSGESPSAHPDDILRVVGNYAMTPIALRSLSRDLRKLIREYEASCRP